MYGSSHLRILIDLGNAVHGTDICALSAVYAGGFRKALVDLQESYRARKSAFDDLFSDRPYDTNGSGAYRWSKVLERLDSSDPSRLALILSEAAGC